MSDQGRQVIGRIDARASRKPAKGRKARQQRLAKGRSAASNLVRGTIAKNRENQSTDSNQ